MRLDAVTRILRQQGDKTTELHYIQSKDWFVGHGTGRKCLIAGENNDSDTCVLIVRKNGDVWYHCHDNEAHAAFQGKKIGSIRQTESPSTITHTEQRALFDELPEQQQMEWADGVELTEHADALCLPFEAKESTRCYCVLAGMSMGKTHQTRDLISKLPSTARVLFVSTRRAFGFSQKGDYKCAHYKDKDDKKWEANRFICQYESLWKLYGHNPKYDIIVLDEVRSLISNMCCTVTNKDSKLRQNSDMLKFLMEQARTTCLDATWSSTRACLFSSRVFSTLLRSRCIGTRTMHSNEK